MLVRRCSVQLDEQTRIPLSVSTSMDKLIVLCLHHHIPSEHACDIDSYWQVKSPSPCTVKSYWSSKSSRLSFSFDTSSGSAGLSWAACTQSCDLSSSYR